MIQIAIVEDEEIYVKQLTEYIRKYQTEKGRSIKANNGNANFIMFDIIF